METELLALISALTTTVSTLLTTVVRQQKALLAGVEALNKRLHELLEKQ